MTRRSLVTNLRLAGDLARRDLQAKYRRSSIGLFWLVLTPLGLLGIYSLVFGQVFGVQWQAPHLAGQVSFGFVLPFFVGLAVYLTISDIVNSSTTLFVSKRTYVVKSPFPLWVLLAANLLRASAHAGVLTALALGLAVLQWRLSLSGLPWMITGLFVCSMFLCGLSLLLAAIGPFIGDISEAMRLLLRVLFYATPITYPLSLVPSPYRDWMWLNPMTCMVELLRNPVVFGIMPPLSVLLWFGGFSVLLLALGGWVFSRVKGVISDVV